MPLYQYGDSLVKDKTVLQTVLSLTWESQYVGKTVFILRWCPGGYCNKHVSGHVSVCLPTCRTITLPINANVNPPVTPHHCYRMQYFLNLNPISGTPSVDPLNIKQMSQKASFCNIVFLSYNGALWDKGLVHCRICFVPHVLWMVLLYSEVFQNVIIKCPVNFERLYCNLKFSKISFNSLHCDVDNNVNVHNSIWSCLIICYTLNYMLHMSTSHNRLIWLFSSPLSACKL